LGDHVGSPRFRKAGNRLVPDDSGDLDRRAPGNMLAAAPDLNRQPGRVRDRLLPGRVARASANQRDDLLADVDPGQRLLTVGVTDADTTDRRTALGAGFQLGGRPIFRDAGRVGEIRGALSA
jgi:hypothetical protein